MKTELIPRHDPENHQQVTVEIWYDGKLIGEVQGSRHGPGVVVSSPHSLLSKWHADVVTTKRVEIVMAVDGPPLPKII